MRKEEYIKKFSGEILGIIRTDDNGDQTAYDFPGHQILGYYKAKYNHTTNFTGTVLGTGNFVVNLIYEAKNKK